MLAATGWSTRLCCRASASSRLTAVALLMAVSCAPAFAIGPTLTLSTLVYSKSPATYGPSQTLVLTATFSQAVSPNPPSITITGGNLGGSAVANRSMSETAAATVWTFSQPLSSGDPGGQRIVQIVGFAFGVKNSSTPNSLFTVDATGPTVGLTYSKNSAAVGGGALTLTATFSEAILTAPSLALEASGTSNDLSGVQMSPTVQNTVWTATVELAEGADTEGPATVAVTGGRDAAGNENQPATNASFNISHAGVALDAPAGARRQEPSLPPVTPTSVVVTVRNTLAGSSMRVDQAELTLAIGGRSVAAQYVVTAPALPMTIAALASADLLYLVTPRPGAAVFDSVDLTVSVTMTDLGSDRTLVRTGSAIWTVLPGATRVLGQSGVDSAEANERGLNLMVSGVWADQTRLIVADTFNNRVLVYDRPEANYPAARVALGQRSTADGDSTAGPGYLKEPYGVASDGTRLYVADKGLNRVLVWNRIPRTSGVPADLVLGQPDFDSVGYNTGGAPGSGKTNPTRTSLAAPSGVWTDGTRLAVADSGNSRILIWNSLPTATGQAADLVLGQENFTSRQANAGLTTPTASTMRSPVAVTSDGTNFVVSDTKNNRVLIWNGFPAHDYAPADVVLGHPTFDRSSANDGVTTPTASTLQKPQAVVLVGGRLAVADAENNRVLIWNRVPADSGAAAEVVLEDDGSFAGELYFASILGQGPPVKLGGSTVINPLGLASDGSRLYASCAYDARVLVWNSIPTTDRATAELVVGQPNLTTRGGTFVSAGAMALLDQADKALGNAFPGFANGLKGPGLPATASSLRQPAGLSTDGTRLFAADRGNNRVLVWNRIPSGPVAADIVLGQPDFDSSAPNRGSTSVAAQDSLSSPAGVACDGTRLAVADRGNNRVLIWSNVTSGISSQPDVVLGQENFTSRAPNAGGAVSGNSFNGPSAVWLDGQRLFVADPGNFRVLVWDSVPTAARPADRVLGQMDLAGSSLPTVTDAASLAGPAGVFSDGTRLFVTDGVLGRVLVWDSLPTENGQVANRVLGQPGFESFAQPGTVPPPSASVTHKPGQVLSDGTRLFVADGFGRVLVWSALPTANGQAADGVLGRLGFADTLLGVSAHKLGGDAPAGLCGTSDLLFVSDPAWDRILGFNFSPPFEATLVFNNEGRAYGPEPFAVTATFSTTPAGTPRIAIAGGSESSTANDVASQEMTATAEPLVFTYARTPQSGDDGWFTVRLEASAANDRPLYDQPQPNIFSLKATTDTTPPSVALAYSKASAAVGVGALVITASFSEELVTTPTLAIAAPGSANDVTASPMSGSSTVWTFVATIAAGAESDGLATVTITGGEDAAGNQNAAATNATFTIDTTPPVVALSYSKSTAAVGLGSLRLTATFSEVLASAPSLALDGQSTANDQSAVAMTATADAKVWTFAKSITTGADGLATVSVTNGKDAAGNANSTATNRTFTIDTTPPAVALAFSRDVSRVPTGPLVVTATFSEVLVFTPTLAIAAPGVINDAGAAPLSPTTNPLVWRYAATIAEADDADGVAIATVGNASDAAGNSLVPDGGSPFTIFTARGELVIESASASPERVSLGQRVLGVTMTVANPGRAAVEFTAAAITLNGSHEGYAVTRVSGPDSLGAGETTTFSFDVTVEATAPLGYTLLDGVVHGIDLGQGGPVADSAAAASDFWLVETPAALAVEAIHASYTTVRQGQAGLTVQVTIRNTGQPRADNKSRARSLAGGKELVSGAGAIELAAGLHFSGSSAGYSVSTAPGNVTELAAGASAVLTFTVDAALDAPAGQTPIAAVLSALDVNSGAAATVASTPTASWNVLTLGQLALAGFQAPARVSRGQTFATTLSIRNTGQLTATIASAALDFGSSDLAVAPRAGNPGAIEGGATVTLAFDVAASLTTAMSGATRSFTATATVAGADAASGNPTGATSASLGAIVVANTPPTAVAGPARTGPRAAPLTLDGSGSFDGPAPDRSEGDPLTYSWSVVTRPDGSAVSEASFTPDASPDAARPAFTPDRKGAYVVGLIVHDGLEASALSTTAVTVPNSTPAGASAVASSPVQLGSPATLAATATDGDPEDLLSVAWRFVSRPAASNVTDTDVAPNGSTAAAQAVFTPDAAGDYLLEATFSDGEATATATAALTVLPRPATNNRPPVAAIRPQTLAGGPRVLEMDGSTSSDPDGDTLTYAWTLAAAPAGAVPFNSAAVDVRYTAGIPGSYRFVLSVFDAELAASTAEVTFTVANTAPVAQVRNLPDVNLRRADVSVTVPTTLTATLDGSASSDANGEHLTYLWEIVEAPDRPAGSSTPTTVAALVSPAAAVTQVSFVGTARVGGARMPLSAGGVYVFRLTVSDGSTSDSTTIRVRALDPLYLLPAADAGLDRSFSVQFAFGGGIAASVPDPAPFSLGALRAFIRLDGRESADPQKLPLAYRWTILGVPAGSRMATLGSSPTAFPFFVPDREGEYRFGLVVSNGIGISDADEVAVLVRSTNEPPTASAHSEDLARVRRSSFFNPVLVFQTGDRVVLDAGESSDADLADRGALTYVWRQTDGSTASLEPSTTGVRVSFTPVGAGRLGFELTVRDSKGAIDTDNVDVVVVPDSASPVETELPILSVVSSATSTPATGPDLPEGGQSLERVRSLRVSLPTTVTLAAAVAQVASGVTAVDFTWRQVRGPTVMLTKSEDLASATFRSQTSFVPTTSRVHVFEVTAYPLDGQGQRAGLFVKRQIRVIVDSPESSVPEANGVVTPSVLRTTATTVEQTVTLDGTTSKTFGILAGSGRTLTYSWRQLSGPEGRFENPFAAVTRFFAPTPPTTGTVDYVFELTVDVTPPGDRSEPIFFQVTQQSTSSVAPAPGGSYYGGGYGGGGGGGCALAVTGSPAPCADLAFWGLPLLAIAVLRRRRARFQR